ncbi:molybdate ABC transporter substrate-binding protein [Arthrobacter zhaoguopingii]|uniref:molybdate ABC transporter substrate-binding protein n=1 Tax=Arthrobacter zhaoguopingii TaxID=2681491 RepID=UPI001FE9A2FA|nr:molybdate ABC transporter substrate-binding protein [Arthrobacter zhaoguopingii]
MSPAVPSPAAGTRAGRRRPRHRRGGAAVLACALALTGCGGGADPASGGGDTLTVFAAASLREVFESLAEDYETRNPGSEVVLNFAGSSDLATQIEAGAPVDVFASADASTMERLAQAGLIDGEPGEFARNRLTIAVPQGNPAGVKGFADLAGVRLVACAPQVPCGAAAARIQEVTGVRLSPVSEESSVTEVLGKVISGEADAGLVYVTDALAAGGEIEAVPIPEAAEVPNSYLIGAVAPDAPEAAQEFINSATGYAGQALLQEAGFQPPADRP